MPTNIVSDYAKYLQAEKGLGASAQRSYVGAAESLLALARARPGQLFLPRDWGLEQLDKRALEVYLNHTREARGWAPATVAMHAGALRAFFAFLQSRGLVERNPARSLLPKLPPRHLTAPAGEEEAVRALFRRPARRGKPRLTEAREQLLLELCYGAALRPAMIHRIRSLRVLPRAGLLRIAAGEETLDVPLAAAGLERARRYLEARREATGGKRRAAFWVDERGAACNPARLTRQVRAAMERVGLHGGPTLLRQLAARHFAERGGDTRSVQRLLRAKRLGSLDRYAPPDFQSVLRQFRQIHPRQRQGE
jgi:site-specific recombinase XerC